ARLVDACNWNVAERPIFFPVLDVLPGGQLGPQPTNNVPLFEKHGHKASHSGVCKRDNPGRATPHDNNIEIGRQSHGPPLEPAILTAPCQFGKSVVEAGDCTHCLPKTRLPDPTQSRHTPPGPPPPPPTAPLPASLIA